MPLVDLDDPVELRARWCAIAAVAHAAGRDRTWWADVQGWHHEDGRGNDVRLVTLTGGRAVVFGHHLEERRTTDGGPPTGLLTGAPEWIAQPEVRHRIATSELGFVYGHFSGTWARAAYPGDPWQPLDDGFLSVGSWLTDDEETAYELAERALDWAGTDGAIDDLRAAGLHLVRAAGTTGISATDLAAFFAVLGGSAGTGAIGEPDLAAGLMAAAEFGGPVSATQPSTAPPPTAPVVDERPTELMDPAELDLDREGELGVQGELAARAVAEEVGAEEVSAAEVGAADVSAAEVGVAEAVAQEDLWTPVGLPPVELPATPPTEPWAEVPGDPSPEAPAARHPDPSVGDGNDDRLGIWAPTGLAAPTQSPFAPVPAPSLQTPFPTESASPAESGHSEAEQASGSGSEQAVDPAGGAPQDAGDDPLSDDAAVVAALALAAAGAGQVPADPRAEATRSRQDAGASEAATLEDAMRAEHERVRPRPSAGDAIAAVRAWCRERTAIVPSGFTIHVYVANPETLGYSFDLEPPEVPDASAEPHEIGRLLHALWQEETDAEHGAWMFARLDAAGRTVRVDRWYDQVPSWWEGPMASRSIDAADVAWHLEQRSEQWQPSYAGRLAAESVHQGG